MRMVFAHRVADNTRTLTVRLLRVEIQFIHCVENTTLNRFQTVTHIRQGACDDNADGIIPEGISHLFGKIQLDNIVSFTVHGVSPLVNIKLGVLRLFHDECTAYKVEYETAGGKKGKKKESAYLMNDYELEKFRKEHEKDKIVSLQRYKGLGEMDANQLWETTLDPEQRMLAQVQISDTVEADETTS